MTTDIRLQAETPARTLFAPETVVEAANGWLIAGPRDEKRARPGRMRIPLGAPTAWLLASDVDTVAALPRNDWMLPARLVAYRTQDGPESLRLVQRMLNEFTHWGRLVNRLREQAASQPARTAEPTGAGTEGTEGDADHEPPPDFL